MDSSLFGKYDYCQQCGACQFICPKNAISFELQSNGTSKVVIDREQCVNCSKCHKICPSNRTKDVSYIEKFRDKSYFLTYSSDDEVRRKASSGGACRTFIVESLLSHFVDGVYTLCKTDRSPYVEGRFFTESKIPTYDELSTSIYHSVQACTNLHLVTKVKRLMIVGTSCQLYAMEKCLKGKYDELVKVCIFCKQQKTLDSTRFLAKVMGEEFSDSQSLVSYRGEGWPGVVRINSSSWNYNHASIIPFGRRLWTVPGCNICADPFGVEIESDLTLMDPWHLSKDDSLGKTLVVVHSSLGLKLLSETKNLIVRPISYMESFASLGLTDIERKRLLVDWWKGLPVSPLIKSAGEAERRQRERLEKFLSFMPRMPKLFYRMLNKIIPQERDKILSNKILQEYRK